MLQKDRIAAVVEAVKGYCNDSLFAQGENVGHMKGWKLVMTGGAPRIFTTVGWALADFRINDKYSAGMYVEALKKAGLPESQMEEEILLKVASHLPSDGWERTENFKQAVREAERYIMMPDNHCINANAIKPLKAFLKDEVEYRLVRPVQMAYRLSDMEYLHVAPMTKAREDAVVVRAYNDDMKDSGGLFF